MPVLVPEAFVGRFDDDDFPDEPEPRAGTSRFEQLMGDASTAFRLAPGLLARHRADYHRLVAWLDAEIGRLLDGLDYLGVADRTAIVLTADHGHVLGEGGLIGKCTFAPAAQQVPLLICWPGAGEPSRRRPDLVSGVDLAPTFLSLGGVAPPGGLDGYDLAERLEPRSVFSVIGYGEPRQPSMSRRQPVQRPR